MVSRLVVGDQRTRGVVLAVPLLERVAKHAACTSCFGGGFHGCFLSSSQRCQTGTNSRAHEFETILCCDLVSGRSSRTGITNFASRYYAVHFVGAEMDVTVHAHFSAHAGDSLQWSDFCHVVQALWSQKAVGSAAIGRQRPSLSPPQQSCVGGPFYGTPVPWELKV